MQFGILGPLTVHVERGAIPIGGARARALLTALLLEREPVSVERLAIALFGECAPPSAIKTVRVNVSRLRTALGDRGVLTTTPAGYQLRVRAGELDAERFEELVAEGRAALAASAPQAAADTLRAALALWRGPALADVDGLELAHAEAARLEEARVAALELRLEADLALGAHADVVGELVWLVSAHPLRERLHEQLMLALYRSSRQAEALEVFARAREALVAQLGLEPGPRLRELQHAILRQDPRLDRPPATEAASTPGFVGREAELRALTGALDAAGGGHGGLVLVAGEPGIGKSRLIEELTAKARARGARVLIGRCWEAGGAPPYWPWVQSLRTLAAEDALSAPEAGAAELVELVPELRRHFAALPAPLDSDGARFRVFEAVAELLRGAAAARVTVLVIDDLHAADAPSMLLLRFLARSLTSSRLLVVCAHRDVDPVPGSTLVETLAELAREPVTARLELARLTEADVSTYLSLTAPQLARADVAAELHAETDGNPLFLTETVRLLAGEGRIAVPQTVRDVVGQRVARLSPACSALLAQASVLGREFSVATLGRLSGACDDVLDEALTARVVTDAPGGDGRLRFAHMVIRDTLYDGLTSVRRAQLHRAALAALGEDAPLSERAHHALAGHDLTQGIELARRAGDRARALHAYEEAARLYRAALAALDTHDEARCELLLSVGEAESRAGDTPTAKAAFLAAAELARRHGRPHALAEAAFGYGGRNIWARAAGDPHLVPLLEEALTALGDADPEMRVMMLARLAGALRDEPLRERRDELSREAVELARRSGSPRALAYALDGRIAATSGPDTVKDCLILAREQEEIALRCGDREQLAAAYTQQIVPLTVSGDIPAAERACANALRVAHELKQPARIGAALADRAALDLLLGRLEGLPERIEQAFTAGRRATPELAIPSYHMQRFSLRELTGGLAELEPELRRLASDYPTRPAVRCALTYLHARTGRIDAALRGLDDLALPFDVNWLFAVSLLAETAALLGAIEPAATLYAALRPFEHLVAADVPESLRGSMARYLALLAWTLGNLEDADAHFVTAEASNERLGARPWLAYTRDDHARLLALRGEHERARQLHHAAHATYRELGMATPGEPQRVSAIKHQ